MSAQDNLASAIRIKRDREGLSLRQAGEASGVAFSTLGRIENGAEPSLKVDRLIRAWLDGETATLPAPPMTLRDWFAGMVLASAAALPCGPSDFAHRASVAYGQADAMLTARARLTEAQP